MTHPDKPAEKDWTSLTIAEFLAILEDSGIAPAFTDKPADDWTQTDELAARFMAALIAAEPYSANDRLVRAAFKCADAFEAERQRRKGAGE